MYPVMVPTRQDYIRRALESSFFFLEGQAATQILKEAITGAAEAVAATEGVGVQVNSMTGKSVRFSGRKISIVLHKMPLR